MTYDNPATVAGYTATFDSAWPAARVAGLDVDIVPDYADLVRAAFPVETWAAPGVADPASGDPTNIAGADQPPNLPDALAKDDAMRAVRALQALSRIDALAADPQRIATPFPTATTLPYKSPNLRDIQNTYTAKIKIKKLIATQPSLRRGQVAEHIGSFDKASPVPTVICCPDTQGNDRYYIGNGHHRATALWLLGYKKLLANVIDADPT